MGIKETVWLGGKKRKGKEKDCRHKLNVNVNLKKCYLARHLVLNFSHVSQFSVPLNFPSLAYTATM